MGQETIKAYIAVKLKGFQYWVWFKDENVTELNHTFVGKEGWGKGGTLTNIDVSQDLIEGIITSQELQYN